LENLGVDGRKLLNSFIDILGWDWLHEDREGYNWWAVVNIIIIISGFHKIQ
jgi:hypothetical protein